MKNFFEKKLRDAKGQSSIEFITVVVVVFFFLLFYLSLSILMVTSDYIDYATFMAARTYKSAYGDISAQKAKAQQVFQQYTDNVQGIAHNLQLQFVDAQPGNEQTAGVIATYDIDMFYLPPVFITKGSAPVSRISLSSEAHLGREPNYDECIQYFNNFSQKFGLGIEGTTLVNLMADNAC